jgi:hypothetical protein
MRLYEIAARSPPTRTFAKLFHVGTLNRADKQRGSYEGAGLSVSLHPEDWMQIARLGSRSIWKCVRVGNRFIDFYRLSKPHKAVIADWAVEQGLAQQESHWRVSFYDEEAEETRYFDFTDPDEAQAEFDDLKHAQEDETAAIKEMPGSLTGTPLLYQRMMQDRPDAADAVEYATIAYAEDVMKIDGVWFNERLDPENLSAPRGVIVPSMVRHWRFSPISA